MAMSKYLQIIRNQQRPIKFLLPRALMKTGLCRFFIIHQKGFMLRFYPTSGSAKLWIDPSARKTDAEFDVDFFFTYLKEGDIVIDVGANIGRTALAASVAVGDRGKVFAFEAHPRIFQYLKGNISLNRAKNVHPFNMAVGEGNGGIFFSDSKWDDTNREIDDSDGVEIEVGQLDHLVTLNETIALLKIDVEGYEKFVLEGAERLVGLTSCIYFEVCEEQFEKYKYSSSELLEFLESRFYSVFRVLTEERRLIPICGDFMARTCENFLAIRSIDEFIVRTGYQLGV